MILDTLSNSDKYQNLHPLFTQAFDYIKILDLDGLEVGTYEIDGSNLYASVSLKEGYTAENARFEAHNKHIDIQVCPTGSETLGWTPRAACMDLQVEYNEEKDVVFYNDKPDTYFRLKAGQFAIFSLKMFMRL